MSGSSSANSEAGLDSSEHGATDSDHADYDSERLVLIADPSEERGKQTVAAVESWGLQTHWVQDGVEAMLSIQRTLPRAVVLDAALPKMFGFQVCEVVKRNESLRSTLVVLVGAIHHQDRYRRNPSDLYGADVYLEQPDLPDGLLPLLRESGMPIGEESARPDSGAVARNDSSDSDLGAPGTEPPLPEAPPEEPELGFDPASDLLATADPSTESPASSPESPVGEGSASIVSEDDSELAEERERAQRLARIAVSEMVLYQPEKFDRAVQEGNLEAALDLEIQEARALIRQRIGEEVRGETDYIMDELKRVAAERSNPS